MLKFSCFPIATGSSSTLSFAATTTARCHLVLVPIASTSIEHFICSSGCHCCFGGWPRRAPLCNTNTDNSSNVILKQPRRSYSFSIYDNC
jgi:hypothetical protein